MTETTDTRADTTRQQILRAAARQFARLPYHQVGLDDVLAEAELTKGAMYFHFRSKHALALAIIDDQITRSTEAVTDLLARKFSGLETLIDFSYQLAVRDISDDISPGGFASARVDRPDRGAAGEVAQGMDRQPRASPSSAPSARATSSRSATRRTWDACWCRSTWDCARPATWTNRSDFSATSREMWALMLPGFVRPERIDYFRQFIKRRTKIAIGSTSALAGST